jgi:DMSO/TMAO reductase YedYZ molybdopterin-dependent catalytic subunit
MRINRAIFAGLVAALASWIAPALASNSKPQPVAEPPASSSCSAMQPTADGTWQRQPCQELGSPQHPPRKSAARGSEQQTR